MPITLKRLTSQIGARDWRRAQGYTRLVKNWSFGTNKPGATVTSEAQLLDDWLLRLPYPELPGKLASGANTLETLLQNGELQRYRDSLGYALPQSALGPLHVMTPNSLKLMARLNTFFDSNAKLSSLHIGPIDASPITNTTIDATIDTSATSGTLNLTVGINAGFDAGHVAYVVRTSNTFYVYGIINSYVPSTGALSINVFAGSGHGLQGPVNWQVRQNYMISDRTRTQYVYIGKNRDIHVGGEFWWMWSPVQAANCCQGRISSYNPLTGVVGVNCDRTFTGDVVHGSAIFAQRAIESGIIVSRQLFPPSCYIEARYKQPDGRGVFPADWIVGRGQWPGEIDTGENFDDGNPILGPIYTFAKCGSLPVGGSLNGFYKGRDISSGQTFSVYGLGGYFDTGIPVRETMNNYACQWMNNNITFLFNGCPFRQQEYTWRQNDGATGIGAFGSGTNSTTVDAHIIHNVAYGPANNANTGYVPNDISKFPTFKEIESIRVWERP